ncbi:MAG TPA: alpha/beta fold hydrolase [Anaerolineae bacterium]|nr:alpha/beta fold hydrolase [Anaerolineae bacterium]HOQ97189.1 alpha/beta fold hydrolase [Anaerolineae bacterium]HPL26415.1 alpha/beta fold hydrolase [Anaerolineae bacterium]
MPHADTTYGRLSFVRRAGSAEVSPVLFVHGAGGNALLWGSVMNRLPGTPALAVDLPGHGRSPGPGLTSIATAADAVLALAGALGVHEFIAAGHSMGGGVAIELALRAPERVRGLILLAVTARLLVAPALLEQLVADPPAARRWIVEAGYGPATTARTRALGEAQLAGVAPEVLHGDFVACSVYDARERLGEVHSPALVLCGADDRLTPPKYVRALAEGLPNAHLEIIAGAGHMLPMEAPGAVAAAISAFLSSSSRG